MMGSEASELVDNADLRKRRGAFFTPEPVCDFVAEWAIHSSADRVLEPSCGEAAFMLAAARRFSDLGAALSEVSIEGAEIHSVSAKKARKLMIEQGIDSQVLVGDFLARKPVPSYDVVIGNPPYIRFQDFSSEARTVASRAALRQGVRLTKLASSWAAFVVHSAAYLSDSGRLGLVLPAELLAANYAGSVRRYLLDRFESVRLITFEEPVFPGVMTEAILLLCEGKGSTDHFTVHQLRSVDGLASLPPSMIFTPKRPNEKWTGALVRGSGAQDVLNGLAHESAFGTLGDWGRVALGTVSGGNDYFMLSPQRAAVLGIEKPEFVKVSPPGSRHLRGIRFTSSAWSSLGKTGSSTLLFRPSSEPSKAAMKYIRLGEKEGVHLAYKCRVRNPWWRVPLVATPDMLITCMNGDTPRLVTNEARVRHLNSVHGLYLLEGLQPLATALAVASLNSATLLGAEVVGRAYGGGILKLEPSEALRLPVPSPARVLAHQEELVAMVPRLRKILTSGDLLGAVAEVDKVVLESDGAVSPAALAEIRLARSHLAGRRSTRSSATSRAS